MQTEERFKDRLGHFGFLNESDCPKPERFKDAGYKGEKLFAAAGCRGSHPDIPQFQRSRPTVGN
jgi:hypothetical protein